MASDLTVNKLLSEVKITQYDFDPNAATATAVGWVDMRDFGGLAVSFFRTVGVSDVTLVIQAATDSSGTSAQTIVSKTFTVQPDAVGDYAFLECLSQQIAQVASESGYALRYASAVITFATGTDEGVVTYIQSRPRNAYDALTADNISV